MVYPLDYACFYSLDNTEIGENSGENSGGNSANSSPMPDEKNDLITKESSNPSCAGCIILWTIASFCKNADYLHF